MKAEKDAGMPVGEAQLPEAPGAVEGAQEAPAFWRPAQVAWEAAVASIQEVDNWVLLAQVQLW